MTAKVQIDIAAEDKASGVLGNIAKGIAQGFGQEMFRAVEKGIGAIPNMIQKVMDKTMEWGGSLDDIGDVLGTTTEQSAGLNAMFQTIGGSADQLTGAIAIMTKGLTSVNGEIGPTGKALQSLGIKFTDAKGKILPATTIFQNVANKIGALPDSLEKTSMMMDIFGKSGKEMGDALAEAANGGMDLYIKRAKEMGLAIDPDEIVQNKKATESLNLALTGIGITLGRAVLPFVRDVAYAFMHGLGDPSVKDAIAKISEKLQELGGWLSEKIPLAIRTVISFWDTVLLPSMQGVWSWISTTLIPVFQSVSTWLSVNIPAAIQAVSGFWNTTFLPAVQGVENWIRTNLNPAFDSIAKSLTPMLTGAIQTASDWFTGTFVPALQELVNYINGPMKTAFGDLALQMNTELPAATDSLKTKFYYQLYPAFIEVRDYINAYVVPIFQDVKDIVSKVADLAITPLKNLLAGAFSESLRGISTILKIDLSGAFDGVRFDVLTPFSEFVSKTLSPALSGLHGNLMNIKTFLDNIKLPSWMTTGITIPVSYGTPTYSWGTPGSSNPGGTPFPGEDSSAALDSASSVSAVSMPITINTNLDYQQLITRLRRDLSRR